MCFVSLIGSFTKVASSITCLVLGSSLSSNNDTVVSESSRSSSNGDSCLYFQNKLISIKFLCQMLWNLKPLRIYNSFVRYDVLRGYLSNFPKAVIVDAS